MVGVCISEKRDLFSNPTGTSQSVLDWVHNESFRRPVWHRRSTQVGGLACAIIAHWWPLASSRSVLPRPLPLRPLKPPGPHLLHHARRPCLYLPPSQASSCHLSTAPGSRAGLRAATSSPPPATTACCRQLDVRALWRRTTGQSISVHAVRLRVHIAGDGRLGLVCG